MARYTVFSASIWRRKSQTCILSSRTQPMRLPLLHRTAATQSHSVPKIGQSSIWHSIVPRIFRNRLSKSDSAGGEAAARDGSRTKTKPLKNPATYFIWIYILIGSQAIRILQAQHEFKAFMRKADLKIEKLRQVVEAIQKGEEIDVEQALGTGDAAQELEWEEALREIENEDLMWQRNRQRQLEAKRKAREEAAREAAENTNASPVNNAVDDPHVEANQPSLKPERTSSAPGFH